MGIFSAIGDVASLITGNPLPAAVGNLASDLDSSTTAYAGYQAQQNTNATNLQIANNANAFNASQAASQQAFQDQEFNHAMGWEESMSDTAYQRATKDMEAAGLNPMLAYQQGGASTPGVGTPSGSAASAVTATMQNPVLAGAQAASMGANTALTAAQTKTEEKRPAQVEADTARAREVANQIGFENVRIIQDTARLLAQTNLTTQEQGLVAARVALAVKEGRSIDADTANTIARTGSIPLQNALTKVQTQAANLDIPERKAAADFWSSSVGHASYGFDRGVSIGAKALGAVGSVFR